MSVRWATPKGFPSYVKVSTDGRVVLEKRTFPRNGGTVTLQEKELKTKKDRGYVLVQFRINGDNRAYRVHRLVLLAHADGDGVGLDCNHKNGVRDDNRIENLEWCTRSENHKHAYRKLGRVPAMKGKESPSKGKFNHHKTCRPIVGRCLSTGAKVEFPSINEAGRQGFSRDGVAHCVIGNQKTSGGYAWSYREQGDGRD